MTATFRRISAPNPTKRSLQQRIRFRLMPIFILLVVLAIIPAAALPRIRELEQLATQRSDVLNALNRDVNDLLARSVTDVTALAASSFVRAYNDEVLRVENPVAPPARLRLAQRDMLRALADLVTRNPERYLAIHYYTRDNAGWGEVVNASGQITLGSNFYTRNVEDQDEAYISLVAEDITDEVRLGASDFETGFIRVYAPIPPRSGEEAGGILALDLNLISFNAPLSQVNDGASSLYAQQRRSFLVNSRGQLIASSDVDTNFDDARAFLSQTLGALVNVSNGADQYSSLAIAPYSGLDLPWRLALIDDTPLLLSSTNAFSLISVTLVIIVGTILLIILDRVLSSSLRPLENVVTTAAERLTTTEVPRLSTSQVAAVSPRSKPMELGRAISEDAQVGTLMGAIEIATSRISSLAAELEAQTRRRARDIDVAARIGRATAQLVDIDELVTRAIQFIIIELGVYHAQVFLVDDVVQNAVLSYSHGDAGRKLIEVGHKLRVGSDTVVGRASGQKLTVIVNDTRDPSARHGFNALLPDTRAEIALPLLIGDRVIGVLDIQSAQAGFFTDEDLPVYELLSDQLAVAINKAQLLRQTEQRIDQINALNRQYTRTAWEDFEDPLSKEMGYTYNLSEVKPATQPRANTLSRGIYMPISVRGEVIGEINASPPLDETLTDNHRNLLRSVAERVALAVENARLFTESQNSLSEARILYELSRNLNEADSFYGILQAVLSTVVNTSHRALMWLFPESVTEDRLPNLAVLRSDYSNSAVIPTDQRPVSLEGVEYELGAFPFLQRFEPSAIVLIPDTQNDSRLDPSTRALLQNTGIGAGVFVPLYVRSEWLGILVIGFPEARDFSLREQRLFPAMIDPLSIATDNRLLFERNEATSTRNENLYSASRNLNNAKDYSDLVGAAFSTTTDINVSFSLALLEGEPDETGWPTMQRVMAYTENFAVQTTNFRHRIRIAPDSPIRDRTVEVMGEDSDASLLEIGMRVPWLPHPEKIRFMAIYPLFSGDDPIALFYVTSTEQRTLSVDENATYGAITGQMSTQLQNRQLLESTAEALEDTRRLYVATRAISSAQSLEDIYFATADHIARPAKLAARETEQDLRVMVWLARPDATIDAPLLEMAYEWSSKNTESRILDEGRRTFWTRDEMPVQAALHDSQSIILNVTDSVTPNTPEAAIASVLHANGAASALIVQIESRSYWFGVMIVHTDKPEVLNARYATFAETTAGQLALALENKLLFAQTESALHDSALQYQASRALSNATNSQDVLDILVKSLVGPDSGHAFVVELQTAAWNTPGASVRVVAEWVRDSAPILYNTVLLPNDFPAWTLLASPDVITINDRESENARAAIEAYGANPLMLEALEAKSLVIIPLRVQNRIIGAIWISGQEPQPFRETDKRIFQSFGEQASLSLDASRLLGQTNRRAQQLQTSAEVSNAASQILDLEELLPRLVELVKVQFGYDHAQIFLMDDRDEFAELRASTGEAGKKLLSLRHKLRRGSSSVIGQVTENGRPIIASDTADAEVVHAPNPVLPDTRSEMALPLNIKNKVIGALDVQSNNPNAFTPDDISALTTLAAQISVAIENANLYAKSQDEANRMGFLFEITTSAAAATTVNDALQRVADSLDAILSPRDVVIYIKQLYADPLGNTFEALDATAFAGFGFNKEDVQRIRISEKGGGALGEVARSRQVRVIGEVAADLSYHPLVPNAASALIVPLVGAGEMLGLITMEGTATNQFGPETVQLVQTLAGSLAAIIQNAQFLDRLARANVELRDLDKLKSDFLANMSHELRTPLNSIIGFSRMMLKGMSGQLSEMQEQDLNTIFNSGNHLLTVINEILDQAKIAAGKMTVSVEEFDVKPELEAVKSIGLGLVKDKPIDLRMEVSPNMPKVFGDKVRVRQVMLNLVSNASKFTRQGSVIIRAYPVQIEGKTWVRVDVIDSGIGIADKDMPLLFEPFRQVDSSLTRTAGGTGLGLPIARSLMQLMGGTLEVSSIVNTGSTFSITIPTEPMAQEEESTDPFPLATPQSTNEMAAIPADSKPMTPPRTQTPLMDAKRQIMVVEDNPDMVDQYRRTLQRQGFEVIVASSMLEARAIAPTLQPTLIIMDVDFDNGSGWELLEELHMRDDTSDIPVIIATLNEENERAAQQGAFAFLQRPYAPDQLIEAVMRAEQQANIPRILLIDDQDDALKLLGELLREHGSFRVYTARSGMEGLMQVAFRRPQLVILDLRMPEMDGFAVLQELRQNPETSHIPVMIVTNDDTLKDDERQRLMQVHVVQKAAISLNEYDSFIRGVSENLRSN